MTEKVEDTKETVKEDIKKTDAKEVAEVEKLSDDDIKWRAKYKMSKSEYEEYKASTEKEKQDLLKKYETTTQERHKMQDKLIEAKLEAHAAAAGIKDLELVKLIDKSALKVDEKGDVVGVEEAIKSFKERKPDFFGVEKKASTSTNAATGAGTATASAKGRNAWDIPKDEWKRRAAFHGDFR